MSYITYNNISLMTLKFTVVFVSLGLCAAQPILNNNAPSSSQEDVTTTNVRKEDSTTKAGSAALVQLVVDNDDARRKWYQIREQILHDSRNGANGHFVKGKDNDEADASAIPQLDNAPVATPEQLRALLKKRPGFGSDKTENQRVVRQTVHPGFQVPHGGFPHAAVFASPHVILPQPNLYTSPAPPPTSAPVTTTAAAVVSVKESIQNARDEYRKSRFEGSAYALALKLSKAGNTPLSEGGSYSG